MELAHLIELAYKHYDCQQAGKSWKPQQTKQLIGSTAYLQSAQQLDQNNMLPNLPGKVEYEILDFFYFTGFWWTKPETVPFGFIAKRLPSFQTGNKAEIFVVFRGTREVQEWYRNFDFTQEPFFGDLNQGWVSKGFHIIYTRAIQNEKLKRFAINQRTGGIKGYLDDPELSTRLFDIIHEIGGNQLALADVVDQQLSPYQPNQCKVFVTGHSLGGALATLATCHIKMLGYDVDLYTFASPRVGDPTFAKNFEKLNCYRIANSEDLVTVVPPATERVVGYEMLEDMTKGRKETVFFLERLLDLLPTKILEQTYQHVGTPLYFTNQQRAASTNHNMFITYRGAIPRHPRQ